MLIPAIDLMDGHIVQLVQGEKLALQSDDIEYWIDRFHAYKLVQLIDLDAAKRRGNNRDLLQRILTRLPCQVGGGIRNVIDARTLLDLGAKRVIFGSSLFSTDAITSRKIVRSEFASHLASELDIDSLVFSVDTKDGHVAVRGWQDQLSLRPDQAIEILEPFCSAFLYTHVDTEGLMQGFPIPVAQRLRALTKRQLIVAGGIRDRGEIDALHSIGVDCVAGMAVYTGVLST